MSSHFFIPPLPPPTRARAHTHAHLCAEGALLTQSKVILWPAFPGQIYEQRLPSCEDKRVRVCRPCVHMHARAHAHTYPMKLSIQCWEPAAAKPPSY